MRVFLYEYTCAVAPGCEVGDALHREGRAMLTALAQDMALVQAEPCCLLATGRSLSLPGVQFRHAAPGEEEAVFRQLAAECDWSIIIAPESDDILAQRCRWVTEAGGRLLGPAAETVKLVADKLRLSRIWLNQGVATPRTVPACPESLPSWLERSTAYPIVCKPRSGAGAQATFVARSVADLERTTKQAAAEKPQTEFVLQPLVPGVAASVSFLMGPRARVALLPAAQRVEGQERLRYEGGQVPLPSPLAQRAIRLAEKAVTVTPGL